MCESEYVWGVVSGRTISDWGAGISKVEGQDDARRLGGRALVHNV